MIGASPPGQTPRSDPLRSERTALGGRKKASFLTAQVRLGAKRGCEWINIYIYRDLDVNQGQFESMESMVNVMITNVSG